MHPRNQEFIGMAKLCGWSQAETARQLRLTPGAVSQIFHGKTHPHPRTLRLFKLLLTKRDNSGSDRFERIPGLNRSESDLLAWMRQLHRAQQKRFFEVLKVLFKRSAYDHQRVIGNLLAPRRAWSADGRRI